MKVGELISLLEDMDQEAEVRLATQPHWPLAFSVRGIFDPRDGHDLRCEEHGNFECNEPDCIRDEPEPVVWIVEGGHPTDASPYAPRAAFEAYVS